MTSEASSEVDGGIDTLALSRRQHRAFLFARLILVLLFVMLWALLWAVGFRMPYGFAAVLVGEAVALAAYSRLLERAVTEKTLNRLHYALLIAELFFHTAIFYFLGGLSWLGAIAYIYALLYATVFLSWRQAVAFTGAVVAAFVVLVSLDGAGVIPHQWYLPQGPDRFRDPEFMVATTVAFAGVMATVTFWMVFIGNEVRRQRDDALRANAELLAVQAQIRALNEELERKVEERTEILRKRAETDPLTGLLNRGAIARRLSELLALAHRGDRPLTVVLADGDTFKACNDVGGHPYGDVILQFLSRALAGSCRGTDHIGRMGGDEFLMVLPDTDAPGAVKTCRRAARYIEQNRERAWHGLPVPSLSFGIAVYPRSGTSVEALIRAADQAMYQAKRDGGNCWRFSPEAEPRAEDMEAEAPVSY